MSGLYNVRSVEQKKKAMHLAIAQFHAQEALAKLKAEGVIASHSMASTSGSFAGGFTYVSRSGYTSTSTAELYPLRKHNRFSQMFESVYFRLKDSHDWKYQAVGGSLAGAAAYGSSVYYGTTAGGISSYPSPTLTQIQLDAQTALKQAQAAPMGKINKALMNVYNGLTGS